jgi:hypothetical protein
LLTWFAMGSLKLTAGSPHLEKMICRGSSGLLGGVAGPDQHCPQLFSRSASLQRLAVQDCAFLHLPTTRSSFYELKMSTMARIPHIMDLRHKVLESEAGIHQLKSLNTWTSVSYNPSMQSPAPLSLIVLCLLHIRISRFLALARMSLSLPYLLHTVYFEAGSPSSTS